MTLTARVVATSRPPENMNSHGKVKAERVPSAIRLPSETSGGWMPNPK
jgi:hypothetical protein